MSTSFQKKINMKHHKGFDINVERYESAMDVADDCKRRSITDSNFKDMKKESMGSFEGVRSYGEALDLLKNGYQPTVDALKGKLNANKTGAGKRISFKNDIQGFAPIVPLALKGVPQSMIGMTMKPIKCKVIDVYYDITCNCSVESIDIIKNGQKLLGAIIDLEKQGYRFNVYAVQSYTDSTSMDMLLVKIKSSDRPIDLKRMSFPLTHTGFFRVIGFDWYSKTPNGKFRGRYGRAMTFELEEAERKDLAKQLFGDNAVMIFGREILDEEEKHIKEALTENEKNTSR